MVSIFFVWKCVCVCVCVCVVLQQLAVPCRRLVCYCRLCEVADISKKENLDRHQREIFLFNDILLVYFDHHLLALLCTFDRVAGLVLVVTPLVASTKLSHAEPSPVSTGIWRFYQFIILKATQAHSAWPSLHGLVQ